MQENLLSQLKVLLKRKQSNKYYAAILGITEQEVAELRKELKSQNTNCVFTDGIEIKDGKFSYSSLEDIFLGIFSSDVKVDKDKGTLESTVWTDYEPKDDAELAILHKVNLDKYTISNYYSKYRNGKYGSTVFCKLRPLDDVQTFQEEFKEFLKEFKPSPLIAKITKNKAKPNISLILPKQDAHFNKFDINGDNDIDVRFNIHHTSVLNMLHKASSVNNIKEVVYIVGSDQFNSEWTNATTKGTPQKNILTHQEAFKAICNHEVEIINTLLHYSETVKVVFLPGNHDQFVGWHLVDWLESYYRDNDIEIDSSIENTKYHKFGNTGIMFNHGDAIKPKELAAKFPIGFKHNWSKCDNYIIFTGDKHTELSLDIHGIKFYQVPQLSSAKSDWDDKQGYIDSKAEVTSFVITENNGMSDIYKDLL